jgi:hypothetical protein
MDIQKMDDILFDSCQYLNNNPDASGKKIIDDKTLLKCEKMFEYTFDSNSPSIQTNLLNNLDNTFNPMSGLFEKCKDQENTCLNTVLHDEVNLFGEKIFGDKRNEALKETATKINKLKLEVSKNESKLKELQTQQENSLNKELIEEKQIEINALNKNIQNLISNYREEIDETYNGKLNSQFDTLIYYYKLVEANKNVINKLKNDNYYITKKNQIINERQQNIINKYYILIGLIIIVVILNIIAYYFYKKK